MNESIEQAQGEQLVEAPAAAPPEPTLRQVSYQEALELPADTFFLARSGLGGDDGKFRSDDGLVESATQARRYHQHELGELLNTDDILMIVADIVATSPVPPPDPAILEQRILVRTLTAADCRALPETERVLAWGPGNFTLPENKYFNVSSGCWVPRNEATVLNPQEAVKYAKSCGYDDSGLGFELLAQTPPRQWEAERQVTLEEVGQLPSQRQYLMLNGDGHYRDAKKSWVENRDLAARFTGRQIITNAAHFPGCRVELLITPKQKLCSVDSLLHPHLRRLLELAPNHESVRALLLSRLGVAVPLELDNWPAIREWIEWNVNPPRSLTVPSGPVPVTAAPRAAAGNDLMTLHFAVSRDLYGRASFYAKESGRYHTTVSENLILEEASECDSMDELLERLRTMASQEEGCADNLETSDFEYTDEERDRAENLEVEYRDKAEVRRQLAELILRHDSDLAAEMGL